MDVLSFLNLSYYNSVKELKKNKQYIIHKFNNKNTILNLEEYKTNNEYIIESYNHYHVSTDLSKDYSKNYLILELKNDLKLMIYFDLNKTKASLFIIRESDKFYNKYYLESFKKVHLKEFENIGINLNEILEEYYKFLLSEKKIRLKIILKKSLDSFIREIYSN